MRKMAIAVSCIFAATTLIGCSNARKAELTHGGDPQKAVLEVTQLMVSGLEQQNDVLADNQFEDGQDHLGDARDDLRKGRDSKKVLENAAIAKAYFQDAANTAKPRRVVAGRILDARHAALVAGLRNSPPLVEELKDVDDDLKDETSQFSEELSPQDFSEFQKKYLALEIKAVQFRELNAADFTIQKAIDDSAKKLAPKTLRTASLDYNDAKNIIAQSPRSPDIYKKSVHASLESAMMLQDVMDVIKGAEGTPEKIAVQIVTQKRALGELTSNVGRLKENLASTQQSLQEKEGALQQTTSQLRQTEGTLKATEGALQVTKGALSETQGTLRSQQEQLATASQQVRFQRAMDEARKTVPQSDALVYQQGNTLVFRLKRINFKSGKAVIPDSSKPVLSKVNSIISHLDAKEVLVQGHTDSVGSAAANLRLSKARAVAVANYLKSLNGGYVIRHEGYGETMPIASNETAKGRSTNRRVDLIVSVKK